MFATGLVETAANATTTTPPPPPVGFNPHMTYYQAPPPPAPVGFNPNMVYYQMPPPAPAGFNPNVVYYQMPPLAPFNPHPPAYYQVQPPPVRPDNGLQVRCFGCKKFYLPSQNSPQACKHHKGKFEEPPAWQGGGAGALNLAWMTKKWNCCGDIAQSSEGCCVTWHVEDVATTQILNKFERSPNASSAVQPAQPPVQPSPPANPSTLVNTWFSTGGAYGAPPQQQPQPQPQRQPQQQQPQQQQPNTFINRQKQQELEEKAKRESEEEKELQKRGYFKHHVKTTDTLQGVSLRYGIPVDDIKQVNKLFNASSLISRRYIYVKTNKGTTLPPPVELSEEQRKRSLVSKFVSIGHDSSKEEARAYLESTNWDLDAALQEYDADRAWENANGGMRRK